MDEQSQLLMAAPGIKQYHCFTECAMFCFPISVEHPIQEGDIIELPILMD